MSCRGLVIFLLVSSACGAPDEERSALHKDGPPADDPAFRQGYTQAPPRGAPGFPPPIDPFLTPEEVERAVAAEKNLSDEDRHGLGSALTEALQHFDLRLLRATALTEARSGRIPYRTAAALHRDYLYPNSEAEADARYKGRFIVLTGRVAPESMLDWADGFKVYREAPYVHDPVLLETDFELAFVRCHLERPDEQPLRDWQEVHILGIVEGKQRSDVVLQPCVVL